MKLSLVSAVPVGFLFTALAAFALTGCGSDEGVGAGEGDASADGSAPPIADGGVAHDAATDVRADSPADAPADGAADGDASAGVDAGVDTGTDASDAGSDAPVCTPSCGAAHCGDDGCGGSCGACPTGQWCGGGGVAGECGSASSIPPYPGVTPTQIDHGAALGLRVAGDEKHVLVQRTEVTQGPNAFSQGALAVVTIGASGAGSAQELSPAVDFTNGRPRADFTADSKGLFFVDASSSTRKLMAAAADGSGLRTLASGGIQSSVVAGQTLVYVVNPPGGFGNREVWAVVLPNGTPVRLIAAGTVNYPTATPSPTGTAVLVQEGSTSSYQLVQSATGAATVVGSKGQNIPSALWSPDGGHLVYAVSESAGRTLHAVNADGTGDQLLGANVITDAAFSPDGRFVAYGKPDATGKLATVIVRDIVAATDIALTASTAHTWESIAFSSDGNLVLIKSGDDALAAASAGHAGAFVELAAKLSSSAGSSPLTACAVTPLHDYAAALLPGRAVSVAPTSGGASHTLSIPIDDLPIYEPVASAPRLLAFASASVSQSGIPGSVTIFATDGTGTATTLPGKVLPAFTLAQLWHSEPPGWRGPDSGAGQVAEPFTWGWLGSEIVYEADRGQNGTTAFDVVAATDNAGTVGVIAPGASVWAIHDSPSPTRLFFTRPAQPGVWSTPVPQTPGR